MWSCIYCFCFIVHVTATEPCPCSTPVPEPVIMNQVQTDYRYLGVFIGGDRTSPANPDTFKLYLTSQQDGQVDIEDADGTITSFFITAGNILTHV